MVGTAERSQRAAGVALVLVSVWVIVFTYNEDIVDAIEGVTDAVGRPRFAEWLWAWAPLVLDTVVILASWPLKRRIAKSDGDGDRLWGWWISGALLTAGIHLMLIFTGSHAVNRTTWWLHLLASFLYIVAMGILLTSTLNADPMTLFSPSRRDERPRDWARTHSTLPLILGTFCCYIATPLWYPVISPHSHPIGSSAEGCPPALPQETGVVGCF